MPIYEFICQQCESEFEEIQSFSETKIPDCPSCGSADVTRRVGRPAIHFKGSGWYITDSKKTNAAAKGSDKPAKADAAASNGSEGGKADSDSKSAAKSESTTASSTEPAASNAKT